MDYKALSLKLHQEKKGKIEVKSKVPVKSDHDLSVAYTPGVAEPCREIHAHPDKIYDYTSKGNLVAVVTDGTAVLGLGNIGAAASLPVMEGKAVLFKAFAGVDAFPICLNTTDPDTIVQTVKLLEPVFGGINLEDIAAPHCFEVEERLKKEMNIPIFHDDQHGTAIVAAAGLFNSLKLVGKKLSGLKVVISGAGAAGVAVTKLLLHLEVPEILLVDRRGIIYEGRRDLNPAKQKIARLTNKDKLQGDLNRALKGADVFIGLSGPGLLKPEMVKEMAADPIIMAMANPVPEIMPDLAREAGARVICTGRSDFPNQINNVLAFPGIFRGALDVRASDINEKMKIEAAHALASLISDNDLSPDYVIPKAFDPRVAPAVAKAAAKAAVDSGIARLPLDLESIEGRCP